MLEYRTESVGELMLASFVASIDELPQFTKENSWYNKNNINQFIIFLFILILILKRWMGEKYDGIRFVWNNFANEMYHT